jgi:hypothetical protein
MGQGGLGGRLGSTEVCWPGGSVTCVFAGSFAVTTTTPSVPSGTFCTRVAPSGATCTRGVVPRTKAVAAGVSISKLAAESVSRTTRLTVVPTAWNRVVTTLPWGLRSRRCTSRPVCGPSSVTVPSK